jgi:hypothetical protein
VPSLAECDRILSEMINYRVSTATVPVVKQGFPYHVSLGKYLRFASLLQYHHFTGQNGNYVVDYSLDGFKWSKLLPDCKDQVTEKDTGWNCGFDSWTKLKNKNYTYKPDSLPTAHPGLGFDFSVVDKVMASRLARPNHISQVLLYGKLLSVMASPSKLAKQFFIEHLVSLNAHHWGNTNEYLDQSSCEGNNNTCLFKDLAGFLNTTTMPQVNQRGETITSVTMHVRQGDSCDYTLEHEVSNMDQYFSEGESGNRPCFSVEVYMQRLHQLRVMYNVRRVYLTTDSDAMIERAKKEHEFNWIYLNSSRQAFDKKFSDIESRGTDMNYVAYFSTIADIQLMRFGDIFLGAFTSQLSKLGFYLMCGHKMRLPPFVSLDYPLGCDANEKCAVSDISNRNQTVEQMIMNARDCNKDLSSSGGSSGGAVDDPCGLKSARMSALTIKYPDGMLVREEGWNHKEIFYIKDGTRRSIPDWDTFTAMNLDVNKVTALPVTEFDSIPVGQPMPYLQN